VNGLVVVVVVFVGCASVADGGWQSSCTTLGQCQGFHPLDPS
jgi:hypothetical protein